MDINKLKADRDSLLKQAQDMNELRMKESKIWNDEERSKHSKLLSDAKKIGETVKQLAADEAAVAEVEAEVRSLSVVETRKSSIELSNNKTEYASLKLDDKSEARKMAAHWMRASLGNEQSAVWMRDNGINFRAFSEGLNSKGGIFVPEQIVNQINIYRDSYGVARKWLDISPMTSDTQKIYVDVEDVGFAFYGEGQTIGKTDKTWAWVRVNAEKAGKIAMITNELNADALVAIGEKVIVSLARAAAKLEDQCLILGDSSSTYAGMTGLNATFNTAKTNSYVGAITATGHSTFATVTHADLVKVVATLPEWAESENVGWYMNKYVKGQVFDRLSVTSNGIRPGDQAAGSPASYLNYPIHTSPILSKVESTANPIAYFGDMRKAVVFGDRNQMQVSLSDEYGFAEDCKAIRALSRFGLVVVPYAVGDATDAGCLLALYLG